MRQAIWLNVSRLNVSEMGYRTNLKVLNSADYGMPQGVCVTGP